MDLEVHATFDDATFVYALHPDVDEISIWRVDANTDTLVPAGRVRTGNLPVRAVTDPLGRFLYVNMNYHIEHHLYPQVPFYALPQLNAAIREQLKIRDDAGGEEAPAATGPESKNKSRKNKNVLL